MLIIKIILLLDERNLHSWTTLISVGLNIWLMVRYIV
ncbi:hypothetical protein Anas_14478 [Armadillidium nasatum]|uniref:Uncharacterized protein n=1 Tax=Armadillidium nasatum TaxID=96803 RepID=A0A5N5TDW4_9CRUS|nr:hypothetical protein Anas_14478 [Armadillidium nasatum]